jgi:hypothetical protein
MPPADASDSGRPEVIMKGYGYMPIMTLSSPRNQSFKSQGRSYTYIR